MKTIGHGCSRRGLDRDHNEDLWLCRDDIGLYAVADGMGDDGRGFDAATLALAALQREVEARLGGEEGAEVVLREAVECTNGEVFALARLRGKHGQLACSLTAVLMAEGMVAIAQLGDTRAYLVRDGVVPLTQDHTLGAALVLSGHLTEEESWTLPHRQVLLRGVGLAPVAAPSISHYPLTKGDRLLLTTNGVYRSTDGARPMWPHLEGRASQESVELLVSAPLEGVEGDDRTAVLVDVEGEELASEADALRHLQAHPAFRDLPLSVLVPLRAVGRTVRLSGPTELALKGDALSTMFILTRGALVARDGDDRTHFGEGSVLGFSRLLGTAEVGLNLSCVGPVEFVAVDLQSFRALARKRPWLGVRVMFQLSSFLVNHSDPL